MSDRTSKWSWELKHAFEARIKKYSHKKPNLYNCDLKIASLLLIFLTYFSPRFIWRFFCLPLFLEKI